MGDSVPELAPLASAVGVDAVLDGELIVTDDAGRPDFYALSRRMLTNTMAPLAHLRSCTLVTFVVSDVLWLDGAALVTSSYAERRARRRMPDCTEAPDGGPDPEAARFP